MATYSVYADEWYPVLSCPVASDRSFFDYSVELSDEEIALVERAFELFGQAQNLLHSRKVLIPFRKSAFVRHEDADLWTSMDDPNDPYVKYEAYLDLYGC